MDSVEERHMREYCASNLWTEPHFSRAFGMDWYKWTDLPVPIRNLLLAWHLKRVERYNLFCFFVLNGLTPEFAIDIMKKNVYEEIYDDESKETKFVALENKSYFTRETDFFQHMGQLLKDYYNGLLIIDLWKRQKSYFDMNIRKPCKIDLDRLKSMMWAYPSMKNNLMTVTKDY